MAFVPSYNPQVHPNLVQTPNQGRLDQTYGGGSFFKPPITQDTLKPNATGLINPTGASNTAAVPAPNSSAIKASPLSERQGGDGGDKGGAPDTAPSVQTGPASKMALAGLGMVPGFSVVSGFTSVMQSLGFVGVVGGAHAPMPGTQAFRDVVEAGQKAKDKEGSTMGDIGGSRVDNTGPSGAPDDIGTRGGPEVDSGYEGPSGAPDDIGDRSGDGSGSGAGGGASGGGGSSSGGGGGGGDQGSPGDSESGVD